jgi:hypothetical protein
LPPAGLTTVPFGVAYVLLLGAVGEVCNDADCAIAEPVVISSAANPDINSFLIITPSDD